MTYEAILKAIKKGDISPLYLLHGEEDLLIEEIITKIREQIIDPAMKDFNVDVLWGNEETPETILEKAETLPFLSGKRLILVKGIDSLVGGEEKKILPYLSSPSPTTCLIFTAKKIDARKSFYSTLAKKWTSIHLKPFNRRQAVSWASGRAGEKGLKITRNAVETLIDLTGTNLRRVDGELEKLFLYAAQETIGPDDVKKLVTGTWHESIFSLTDAVGKKNIEAALHLLNGILESGESPHAVFGMIVRQIRLIWLVKSLREKGEPPAKIPARAGIPPFLLHTYIKQGKSFTFKELKKGFSYMQKADMGLKSDRPPRIVLEKLLFDLVL